MEGVCFLFLFCLAYLSFFLTAPSPLLDFLTSSFLRFAKRNILRVAKTKKKHSLFFPVRMSFRCPSPHAATLLKLCLLWSSRLAASRRVVQEDWGEGKGGAGWGRWSRHTRTHTHTHPLTQLWPVCIFWFVCKVRTFYSSDSHAAASLQGKKEKRE